MFQGTKGVNTSIEDRQELYLEGAQAFMGTIVKAVYAESKNAGTPAMEIVLTKNGVEGFKPLEKEFPTDRRLDIENFKEELTITGPMSLTCWWITEKTMDPNSTTSVIQRVMLMADELGVREELDEGMNKVENAKDFVDLFNKLFSGKKAAFLVQEVINRYVRDGVVQERSTTELWPWGIFVMSAEVMDLQMKIDKNPDQFVTYNDGQGVEEALNKATESNESAPDLTF